MRHTLTLALALLAVLALAPNLAAAQLPKLDLSFHLGVNSTMLVPRAQGERKVEAYPGFQFAFGARVRHRNRFLATNLAFRFWGVEVTKHVVEESELDPDVVGTEIIGYALEFPWLAGYIPYKSPLFKVFLYGGYVNQFNLKFRVVLPDDTVVKVRPSEADFTPYQALARAGVSFDLALFNFDLNYSIGLNSATTTDARTNLHVLQLGLGMLF